MLMTAGITTRLLWSEDILFKGNNPRQSGYIGLLGQLYLGRSVQQPGEWHGIISTNALIITYHNNEMWTSPLWSRGPARNQSAAYNCTEFIVEFNNHSINGDETMSLTSFLQVEPTVHWYIIP